MRIDTEYPLTVPIHLNGAGPYSFLLDTGYSSANLSQAVAGELSLSLDSHGCAVLDTFAVGDLVLPGYQIHVRDDSESPASAVRVKHVDGFLGMGFLKYYQTTIDYPSQCACFYDLANTMVRTAVAPEPGYSYVRIRFSGGLIVVPVQVNDQGPYQFLLDTGAQTTIVSPELASEIGLALGTARTARGVESMLVAHDSEAVSLLVGSQRVECLPVSVMDCARATAAAATHIDGYLGHNFLQRFTLRFNVLELWMGLGQSIPSG
ncbi:aspartyl protease family protein [Candidatus Latescibacterota bacterium]